MIEILFGRSEAESMMHVKRPTDFLQNKTDEQEQEQDTRICSTRSSVRRQPTWIEGSPEEVICLGFMLDVGYLEGGIESAHRKNIHRVMHFYGKWRNDEEVNNELLARGAEYCNAWKKLEELLRAGESIRIWYSHAPYALCGFYHLCTLLAEYAPQVSCVELPEYVVEEECVLQYRNWGEVEWMGDFLTYERKLSKLEIKMFAWKWRELELQNSFLRAVVNGRLTSVPEDFYDFIILKMMPDDEINQNYLIGEMLGHYQIGVEAWWYRRRIQQLIDDGKIELIEESHGGHLRIIRKKPR